MKLTTLIVFDSDRTPLDNKNKVMGSNLYNKYT